MRQVPITSGWINQPHHRFPAAARLSEYLLQIEILLILDDEITCFANFAGQRLGRDDLPAPGRLALMPGLGFWTIPADEIGCFHIRPAQIPVAVLTIVFALFLVVRRARGFHATAVRGVIANFLEATNIAGFKHDRQCQNLTNARHRQQLLVFRLELYFGKHNLFDLLDTI